MLPRVLPGFASADAADGQSANIKGLGDHFVFDSLGAKMPNGQHIIPAELCHSMLLAPERGTSVQPLPSLAFACAAFTLAVLCILLVGSKPKVGGVAAPPGRCIADGVSDVTVMADGEVIIKGPIVQQVGDPVRRPVASSAPGVEPSDAVPPAVRAALPEPAVVRPKDLDVAPKFVDKSLPQVLSDSKFHGGYFNALRPIVNEVQHA